MKFISCRDDREKGETYTLEQCVLGAYATDGGMFLPQVLPQLSRELLRSWSGLSFQALVLEFMSLFIETTEVPRDDLQRIIAEAFGKFTRTNEDGTTVVSELSFEPLRAQAGAADQRQVSVAELWHGHTLAFKDLPLQFLGGLLGFFLAQRREKINVLCGTSGDTGSAAIEAVRASPFVNIFVLFPSHGRITRIQELQMTTVASPLNNVHVVACDGTSDELDVPILHMFEQDAEFAAKYRLCSINSVNVIRILMQCTHFIYSYLQVCPSADLVVDFAVPTGAAGHIAAGILTKQMALPIGQLCAATNANDLLATFLNTGKFYPRQTGALQTSSPAIDIQVPYNVERMLYCMSPGSASEKGAAVKAYLGGVTGAAKGFELTPAEWQRWKDFGLVGASVQHDQVIGTISQIWSAQAYLIDPHTSVAVSASLTLPPATAQTHPTCVVFSTAHPAKFLPTVSEATGLGQEELARVFASSPYTNVRRATTLHTLPANSKPFAKGEDWTAKLRQLIVEVNSDQAAGASPAASSS